jgi:hypothetical protein
MTKRLTLLPILCIFLLAIPAAAQDRFDSASYSRFFPTGQCARQAYNLAIAGHRNLVDARVVLSPRYLTIIDFTHRSNEVRLFVLDAKTQTVALQSTVAHGLGSDPDSTTLPYRFSNKDGSLATSIGFYLTGSPYINTRPVDSLGLCLFGLDRGFNDAAAAREIVVHYGANSHRGTVYVTDTGAGRSYGCPALPLSANTPFINLVQGGSVLFIYTNKVPAYSKTATVLKRNWRWPLRQTGPAPNFCSCTITPEATSFSTTKAPGRQAAAH